MCVTFLAPVIEAPTGMEVDFEQAEVRFLRRAEVKSRSIQAFKQSQCIWR